MRKPIIAGNWKMNKTNCEGVATINELKSLIAEYKEVEVIIGAPAIMLSDLVKAAEGSNIKISAQNMYNKDSGAFTGEISPVMLKAIGANHVILGHSERREYFGETDALLAKKVDTALANEMEVIFCFGEVLEDRKSENHFKVVESQISNGLFHLEAKAWKNIVLAYEPVWAIGTGETASPEQAQEMHAFIRKIVADKYNQEVADNVSILYGGSVKPNNAKEIFGKPDVDGGLIGGAALSKDDFEAIIDAI